MTKPVTCDKCKKRFGPTLKTDALEDGGELWWFRCLHCGHRYEVARISAKGVELRAELEAMRKRRGPLAVIERLQKAMAAEVSQP